MDAEIERVIRVRQSVGRAVALRFEANPGYSERDALRCVESARAIKSERIEQPTPRARNSLPGRI